MTMCGARDFSMSPRTQWLSSSENAVHTLLTCSCMVIDQFHELLKSVPAGDGTSYIVLRQRENVVGESRPTGVKNKTEIYPSLSLSGPGDV